MSMFIPDVLDNLLHLPLLGSLDDIVSSGFLVGSDEVWVIDTRKWDNGLHVGPELLLQVNVQHLGPGHSISHVHAADVPTPKNDVIWAHLQIYSTPSDKGSENSK